MIRSLLIALGKKVKGDVFTINPDLPLSAILSFVLIRIGALLRGLRHRPFLARGTGSILFIGPRAKLRTRSKVTIGKGATIGDHCLIQGLSRRGVRIGAGANIGAYTIIMPTSVMRNMGEGCDIGANSGIGQFSYIGCSGGVTIGRDVIMGQYISFHTENHIFDDLEKPIVAQGVRKAPIVIGDDCWIGAKVTFLSGANVGRGCVVAAGAVVRGDIPPYSVIGGVPARILKSRKPGGPLPSEAALQQAAAVTAR